MMPADDKPATMVPTTAPEAPTVTRRPRRWLKIAASVAALVAGAWLYSREVTKNVERPLPSATRDDDNFAQVKQAPQQDRDKTEKLAGELTTTLAQVNQAPQQDRDKTEKLARELTTDLAQVKQALQQERDKTEKVAGELTANLAQVKQALKQTERQSAAYGDLLALERARNQGLAEQLAARRDATPGRSSNATASLSSTPDPTQAPATDKPATSQLPTSSKPGMPAGDKPATVAARPTAPEALGDPELARLISRASLLLSQGNVGTARIVLERAAETGSAPALFALAETYDPTALAAWGTFGTQGDVAKARELYAKAFASGVQEAGDRLNALRE